MSTLPVACTLSAHEQHCEADALLPGLARLARRMETLPDGRRMEFDAAPGIVARIAGVVERERECCRFLDFALHVGADGGPVTLELTGPPGTGEFLASILD